jgi:hypothetical protein
MPQFMKTKVSVEVQIIIYSGICADVQLGTFGKMCSLFSCLKKFMLKVYVSSRSGYISRLITEDCGGFVRAAANLYEI